MHEKIVDAKGGVCPKPLIMTKKALDEIGIGDNLLVLIDNPTSKENVERFLSDNGHGATCTLNGDVYEILVSKNTKTENIETKPEDYCPVPMSLETSHVIAVKSNKMGFGSDELGEILMKAFINTLGEVAPLPGTMIFYNSGIFLTLEGSGVTGSLKKLEEKGLKILVCGTCLDYYQKKSELSVGIISNMYDILSIMNNASSVISP